MIKKIKGFKWINGFEEEIISIYNVVGDGNIEQEIISDIPFLPPIIKTEERMLTFMKSRIVPENRVNLKDFLDEYGLEEYDVEEIFIKTKGRTTDDPFYAEILFK